MTGEVFDKPAEKNLKLNTFESRLKRFIFGGYLCKLFAQYLSESCLITVELKQQQHIKDCWKSRWFISLV